VGGGGGPRREFLRKERVRSDGGGGREGKRKRNWVRLRRRTCDLYWTWAECAGAVDLSRRLVRQRCF
jgi:hypothetical protein